MIPLIIAGASMVAGMVGASQARKAQKDQIEAEKRAIAIEADSARRALEQEAWAEVEQRRVLGASLELERKAEAEASRQAKGMTSADFELGESAGEARERAERRKGFFL